MFEEEKSPTGQQTTHVEGYGCDHRTRVQFPATPLSGFQATSLKPFIFAKSLANKGIAGHLYDTKFKKIDHYIFR